jgi:hypothetical protein
MTLFLIFEQLHEQIFVHLLEWCRAVEILVLSSFFEQMTFEQMTHLHRA